MSTCRMLLSAVVLAVSFAAPSAYTQMWTHVSAPRRGLSGGFYERVGVGWGFRHQTPGGFLFFNNGGPGPLPPFGGFDPGAQANFAVGGRSGNLSWNLGVVASQGSSQSVGSQAPGVVLPNGGTGFFYDTVQRPFVMGIAPVVGSRPISPVQERWMRLRYEQALKVGAERDEDESTDEPLNVSRSPAQPRVDDPPLILGRD